jgi:hypothetical protein
MDTVTGIEPLKSTPDALELDVLRELEVTNAVNPGGWPSTQDFVTAVAGGHQGSGSALVRRAETLETPLLAPVDEALADGWLSVAKTRVILQAIEHLPGKPEVREHAVQVLLEEAKKLDAWPSMPRSSRSCWAVGPRSSTSAASSAWSRRHLAHPQNRAP